MSKTRDDLLKEIADGKKLMLICQMIQWLFWIGAVAVVIAVSGGFWKWAGAVACAAIGVFAWIFRGAAQNEMEKTHGELHDLTAGQPGRDTEDDADLGELYQAEVAKADSGPPVRVLRFQFTRDLKLGVTGADVNQLQRYLISHAAGPAAKELARHGTTEHFGTLTQNALIEFQRKAGIKPANGSFGPITRAYVNAPKP